jgi:hypothetical protein
VGGATLSPMPIFGPLQTTVRSFQELSPVPKPLLVLNSPPRRPSMPMKTASALCVLTSLLCFPLPAAAQFNPGTSGEAILRRLSLLPASSKLAPSNGASGFTLPAVPADHQPSVLQELGNRAARLNLFVNPPRRTADDLEMQPLIATSPCAHMIIARAPRVDSQMVIVAPGGLLRKTPAVRGLPPCAEDVRPAQVSTLPKP